MHRSLDRDSTTAVDTCAPITVRFMQLRKAILFENISKCVMSAISASLPYSICTNINPNSCKSGPVHE